MIDYKDLKVGMEVEAQAKKLGEWVPAEFLSVELDAGHGMAMIEVRLFYPDGRRKNVFLRAWQLRLKPAKSRDKALEAGG